MKILFYRDCRTINRVRQSLSPVSTETAHCSLQSCSLQSPRHRPCTLHPASHSTAPIFLLYNYDTSAGRTQIQMTTVTAGSVEISDPYEMETEWGYRATPPAASDPQYA